MRQFNLSRIPYQSSILEIPVSQYEKGEVWQFTIYENGEVFDLTGYTATIKGTKPGNTGFDYACSISGNVVSVTVQQQMTVLAGKYEAEIRLAKSNTNLGTYNFFINVEKAGLNNDTIVSETDIPLLEQALEIADETAQIYTEINKKLNTANPRPTGTLDLSSASLTRGSLTKTSGTMLFNDGNRVINFLGTDMEVMKPNGTLASGTDLNTLGVAGTGGIYYLASANTYTNAPDGFASGFLETVKPTSNTQACVQRIFGSDGTYIHKWERYYASDWTAWRVIYDDGSLPVSRRGNLPTNSNLNNCIGKDYIGIWNVNSNYTYTNLPTDFTWGTLEIYSGINNAGTATVHLQRLTSSNGNMAWRTFTGGSWSDWRYSIYSDWSTTINGLTVRARRRGNTVSIFVSGTPTTELATSSGYYELATLPEIYRPTYAYINYIFLTAFIYGQLNVTGAGVLRVGNTRNVNDTGATNISTQIYARISYEVD